VDIDRQSENMRIELTPALTLAGSIENSKGTPIPGARVRINLVKGWQAITSVKDVFTDNQGHFEIYTLPQKQEYSISASFQNYFPSLVITGAINRITDRQEIEPIVLTAPNSLRETRGGLGKLAINVIDEHGKGIDDISVMIWTRFEDGSARGFPFPVVPSNKPGLYEIRDIKVGQYHDITIDKNEFARFKKFDVEVKKDNNQPITCILSKGGTIEGFITDEKNNPIEGVPIVVNSIVTRKDIITDKRGHFFARHLPDIRYSINAEPKSDSPYEITVFRGNVFCGQKDIKIILKNKRETKLRTSLVSRKLPGFDDIKINLNLDQTQDKMMFLCFWDINQRPSRNCILQLRKKSQEFMVQDVVIIAFQTSKVEQKKLDEWIKDNNIPFPVGMIQNDVEKTHFTWGVKTLPWLILTDKEHIVRAEGFGINELDEKITALIEK